MTVHAGAPFTDFILTSDPDGGVLSLTAPTLPDWLALSARPDGTGTLSGTPPASAVGAHPVTLRVTDLTGRHAEQSLVVQVLDAPAPPPVPASGSRGCGVGAGLRASDSSLPLLALLVAAVRVRRSRARAKP